MKLGKMFAVIGIFLGLIATIIAIITAIKPDAFMFEDKISNYETTMVGHDDVLNLNNFIDKNRGEVVYLSIGVILDGKDINHTGIDIDNNTPALALYDDPNCTDVIIESENDIGFCDWTTYVFEGENMIWNKHSNIDFEVAGYFMIPRDPTYRNEGQTVYSLKSISDEQVALISKL